MDITAIAATKVLTSYNRQEKYAEARRNAGSQMIKTAVAERVTISKDAVSLLSHRFLETAKQTPVSQVIPNHRRSHSAANEYIKNQPEGEPAVEQAQEAEGAQPASRTQTGSGKPEAQSGATITPQIPLAQTVRNLPTHGFPIPRELQAYISNLPREKSMGRRNEPNQKAA